MMTRFPSPKAPSIIVASQHKHYIALAEGKVAGLFRNKVTTSDRNLLHFSSLIRFVSTKRTHTRRTASLGREGGQRSTSYDRGRRRREGRQQRGRGSLSQSPHPIVDLLHKHRREDAPCALKNPTIRTWTRTPDGSKRGREGEEDSPCASPRQYPGTLVAVDVTKTISFAYRRSSSADSEGKSCVAFARNSVIFLPWRTVSLSSLCLCLLFAFVFAFSLSSLCLCLCF